MTSYVKNYGMVNTYIKKNDEISTNETKWVGDYDGNVANLNIDMNDNGNMEHVHMQLDNDDLLNILNMTSVDEDIERRLKTDFLLDERPISMVRQKGLMYPYKATKATKANKAIKTKSQKQTKRKGRAKSNKAKKVRKPNALIQLSSL